MDGGITENAAEEADHGAEVLHSEVHDMALNNQAADYHPAHTITDQERAEATGGDNPSHQEHHGRCPSRASKASRASHMSWLRGRRRNTQDGPTPCQIRRAATQSREEQYRLRIASISPDDHSLRRQAFNAQRGAAFTVEGADHCVNPNFIDHCVNPNFVETQRQPKPFTLSGPEHPYNNARNFVQRGYAELNPEYTRPANSQPVWSLAKPLPRVVRKGMAPSATEFRTHDNHHHGPRRISRDNIDLEAGHTGHKGKFKPLTRIEERRAERERKYFCNKHGAFHARGERDCHSLNDPATNERSVNGNRSSREAVGNVAQSIHSREVMDADVEADIGLSPPLEHTDAINYAEDESDSSRTEVYDDPDGRYISEDAKCGLEEEHNHHTHWSVIRTRYREPLAELLAVTIQLTLGFCADLSTTASNEASAGFSTAWAWGLSTMVAIYIAGGISGAHLNPAISIMLWVYRGFPVRKIPMYVAAQILGAFIAALIAFGLYRVDIIEYGGSNFAISGTAADFITYPRYEWITAPTAFFNEFVGTAVLAVTVMALGDDSNSPPGAGMNALIIGFVVTVHSMAFGHNTGAALNPSRDFGPRLALLALGYGSELFTNAYWVYGPWAATISGALFGAGIYDIMIFVGGESPINYPRCNMERAARLWKGRMEQRVRRVPKRLGIKRRRSDKRAEGAREKIAHV